MSKPEKRPRKKRSRSQEDKAQQMEKILNGSLDLISSQTFDGFGMRALAKHLGMSQGNLYNYISSKRELWLALRIKCMRAFKEEIEKIASSSKEHTVDTLKKIGRFVFEFAAEDINRWKLMTVIQPPDPPVKSGEQFIGEIERNYESTRALDVIFAILQRGVHKRELQDLDLKLAGIYLYSIVLGVTFAEYDILTQDLFRDSEIHEDLSFNRENLRELAYLQMDQLLRKK